MVNKQKKRKNKKQADSGFVLHKEKNKIRKSLMRVVSWTKAEDQIAPMSLEYYSSIRGENQSLLGANKKETKLRRRKKA